MKNINFKNALAAKIPKKIIIALTQNLPKNLLSIKLQLVN